MNVLTPEEVILSSFKAALAAAYPARTVTRSLMDFAERKKSELGTGVYTILARGSSGDINYQTLKMIVVGQIELGEKATGEEVEHAEMLMAREVKNLIQRKRLGPDMRIKGIDQSGQLEVPYGWVSISIEVGEYDGTEPLTEDELIGNLTDFLTFKADIDIADPHASAEEHAKWSQEPPDYSTSEPDLQTHVTLPRSTP